MCPVCVCVCVCVCGEEVVWNRVDFLNTSPILTPNPEPTTALDDVCLATSDPRRNTKTNISTLINTAVLLHICVCLGGD